MPKSKGNKPTKQSMTSNAVKTTTKNHSGTQPGILRPGKELARQSWTASLDHKKNRASAIHPAPNVISLQACLFTSLLVLSALPPQVLHSSGAVRQRRRKLKVAYYPARRQTTDDGQRTKDQRQITHSTHRAPANPRSGNGPPRAAARQTSFSCPRRCCRPVTDKSSPSPA